MKRRLYLLPLYLGLTATLGPAEAWAAWRLEGNYQGGGKSDLDRTCLPFKFKATAQATGDSINRNGGDRRCSLGQEVAY